MAVLNRSRKDPSLVKMLIGSFFPFFDVEEEAELDEAGVDTGEGETDV